MVLWSYGSGNVGVGEGELAGPHMAEENPFNPGEIVVGEQFGCDTLLIDRNTGKLKVLYGERGVAGSGDHLSESDSAHFMPSGPYKGHVLITEYAGEHRVMVLHRDSGEVLWRYTGLEAPLDAIYWDDAHIMASRTLPTAYSRFASAIRQRCGSTILSLMPTPSISIRSQRSTTPPTEATC